jgi:hypothetical protein
LRDKDPTNDLHESHSGNTGGKPKKLKEIQLEARRMSVDALKTLETVRKRAKITAAAARVAAANAIVSRRSSLVATQINSQCDRDER